MKRLASLLILLVVSAWQTCGQNTPAPPEAPPVSGQEAEHPFFKKHLLPVWSKMTPQQLIVDARAALQKSQHELAAIAKLRSEDATFENSFLAYARASADLKQVQGYMMHLMNVKSSSELMEAQRIVSAEAARFQAESPHEEKIAQLLESLRTASWMETLTPAQQRLVQSILQRLKMNGSQLTQEQRLRKAQISEEIRKLSLEFHHNLANSYQHWELIIRNPAELAGMPEKWMSNAAKAAQAKGYATPESPAWLINLTNSPAHPVLYHCTIEETRKKCWQGITSTGTAHALDNEPLIYRTMELRHELARMLGFKHYADMQAQTRMTGSGETALTFVNGLLDALKPQYDAEVAEYMQRLSQAKGAPLPRLAPWDETYLAHRAPAPTSPAFDSGRITPYLEAERVLQGLFNIWEHMLAIRIEEKPASCLKQGEIAPAGHVEVWHPAVRFFEVHDSTNGTHLGSFYLDLYPRQGKRGDGWTTPIRFGDSHEPHLAAIVTNITPPGNPHLLHHGDMYVIFHEFGHLMHMLLAHPELPEHCAMSVEHDFIETPSQLQELWIWEPTALATFARHHQTGQPLPAELAEKLAASRRRANVSDTIRMLRHSKLDLEMNMYFHEKFKDRPLDEAAAELLSPWQLPYSHPVPSDMRTVHHTMNPGYAASFYTYIWSEVLAVDAFSRFQQEGVMNPDTGLHYRRTILEPGGSKPALQLFRDFMGRAPDSAAFLQRFVQPATQAE